MGSLNWGSQQKLQQRITMWRCPLPLGLPPDKPTIFNGIFPYKPTILAYPPILGTPKEFIQNQVGMVGSPPVAPHLGDNWIHQGGVNPSGSGCRTCLIKNKKIIDLREWTGAICWLKMRCSTLFWPHFKCFFWGVGQKLRPVNTFFWWSGSLDYKRPPRRDPKMKKSITFHRGSGERDNFLRLHPSSVFPVVDIPLLVWVSPKKCWDFQLPCSIPAGYIHIFTLYLV